VEGYEKIEFSLVYVNGAFDLRNTELASYRSFGRCLAVVDANVNRLYGFQIQEYFKYYNIELTLCHSVSLPKHKHIPVHCCFLSQIQFAS